MPDVTSDHFFSLLQQSNLLAVEQLEAVCADFAIANEEQLPQLIEQLIERDWLTRWQAKMLLAGRHAFFLGKYKLLDHLGEGGMGSVLKAEQTPLGRLVAIKTLRKDLVASKDLVARFRREIQAAAALNHPNIVAAYDADSIAGRHFLVMEYVEGRDLGVLTKGGKKLPIGAACEYIRQAALGLQHAHERQMVHRDIKPSNLILDSTGRVKILDMGLARVVQGSGKEQTELTHTGQIVGTPDYISPEQARDTRTADIRSDIYSLGCTLYRLLTGKVPFQGEGAIAKITARLVDDPPALRSALPDAPAELEAVLLKMMSRDVVERYQTPTEVVQALSAFADAATATPTSHETSAAATAAIAPTVAVAVAPELNDFLNQLAVAAALEEEIDTGTQELEKTQAGDQSIDRSAETQKYDPAEAPSTDTSPAPKISRAGRKLQDEIAARKQADKQRLLIVVSAVVLFVAAVGGLVAWNKTGETHLVVDSGEIKLKSATLEVDGRPRQLVKTSSYEYRGRPGTYRITLVRDGYESIEAQWTLTRGESKTYKPEWKPNAETVRKQDMATLQQRVGKVTLTKTMTAEDTEVVKLREDLVDFRRQSPGTAAAIDAAKMMSRLPWPADTLQRDDIDPYELKAAGHGDSSAAPPELVAVLGDSRLKHWGPVTTVAFSPDGKTLASAGVDHTVRLWDVNTGREVRTLWDHTAAVHTVAFSRDGKTLASGSSDRSIKLWDPNTGRQTLALPPESAIESIDFSADGKLLASANGSGKVIIWDLMARKRQRMLNAHLGHVPCVAFNPTRGQMLASGGKDGKVKVWDASTGEERHTLVTDVNVQVASLAFSPDGQTIVAGTSGRCYIWNIDTEKRHPAYIPGYSVAFRPDGRWIACGNSDGTVGFWDVATGKEQHHFQAHSGLVRSVSFSPDGKTLASGGEDGRVKLWDAATGEEKIKTGGHQGAVNAVAVSPDGKRIAAGGADATLKLWDMATAQVVRTLSGHDGYINSVAFSPDGKSVAAAGSGYYVELWDTATGAERLKLTKSVGGAWIGSVRFSPEGSFIAAARATGQPEDSVKLWDVVTGKEVLSLGTDDNYASTLAFSPNGQRLLTYGAMSNPRVYSIPSGKRLLDMEGGASIYNVAYSPDGARIVVASINAYVFNATTGKRLSVFSAHDDASIRGVAFHPYRRLMVTCATDGTVKLWSLEERFEELVSTFQLGPTGGPINEVAFTPDGRHLVTANANGTVYVLRLKEWSMK